MENKKGVSPVVATVLLIAIVVILGLIIFLWARGFIKESVTKTVSGTELNGDQACDQVELQAKYYSDGVQVTNIGNVPVYGIDVKIISGGTTLVRNFMNINLNKGVTYSAVITESRDSVEVYPVIRGERKGALSEYTCQNYFLAE